MHLKQFLNENVSTIAEFILTAEHLREVTSLWNHRNPCYSGLLISLRKAVKNGDGVAKNTNDKGTHKGQNSDDSLTLKTRTGLNCMGWL